METRSIAEGMTVRGADGRKLGTVVACADGSFVVRAGRLHAKDHTVRHQEVESLREGEVYLRRDALEEAAVRAEEPGGEAGAAPGLPVGPSASGLGAGGLAAAGLGAAGAPAGAGLSAGADAADGGAVPGQPEEGRPARLATEEERTSVLGGSGPERT